MKLYLLVLLSLLPLLSWAGTVQANPKPLESRPDPIEVESQAPQPPLSEAQPVTKSQGKTESANAEVTIKDGRPPHADPSHLEPQDPRYWANYCPPCGRG